MQMQETATTPSEAITPQEHPLMMAVHPRFTAAEAVILNTIVNASPGYATDEEILRALRRSIIGNAAWYGPTRNSLHVMVGNIRAKLGEKKYVPSRLASVFELQPNGKRGPMLGFAWKG